MNPAIHFLTGWLIANVDDLKRTDRAVITLAAVVPDVDGFGIIAGLASEGAEEGLRLYGQYHHVIAHNLFFGLLITLAAYAISKRRRLTALLAFLSFHCHLLGDIISGRGPDGTLWSISYLFPVSSDFLLTWSGQWELNAWPNVLVTAVALLFTLYLAWKRGFSPLNILSLKADLAVVKTLRNRFPLKDGAIEEASVHDRKLR